MSYAPKRKKISRATRDYVYARAGGKCYLCHEPIVEGTRFDVDHEIARELGGADDVSNYQPAHPECHREKSKADVALIAKSNRIRRNSDPETRRKTRHPIRNPDRPIQSRGFSQQKRGFRP